MTQHTVAALFRRALDTVPTYQPGKQPAVVPGLTPYKLSSNELHLPPLPEILETMADVPNPAGYPDPTASALIAGLSEYLDVPTGHITVGGGASEIISALARVTTETGTETVYPWPSFELYPQTAALNGGTLKPVALTAAHEHDLTAMADAITEQTRMVLLCSPNNPTGTSIKQDNFEAFMERVPSDVLVVIDEAYWEFCTDPDALDGLAAAKAYDNVVLVRTFSKAHGLAGFRVGYAVAQPHVITALRKAILTFSVAQLSQNVALASLHQVDVIQARARSVAAARDEFVTALRSQGWEVPDAHANFVWLPLGDLAERFEDACIAQAIAVRKLTDGVRISIGAPEAMQRVVDIAGKFRDDNDPSSRTKTPAIQPY
ncbi:histidinol-phosphate transaminase [Enteractinococcus coprophilus]|uniref:Histidinol-phosphate aminotransferase n=1 Tax=Enteractinococcus coprophilus TaxID=1027633 RepID=A0A543AGJ9_9MICC|nr:histidinol-phosphate transaminase [Enteractinococcus coprophilus]TQL71636.1 histidinol-phosphate aminotransferase [Enteractinococcus coprophilus]